jgi:hypothetical protein
VSVIRSAAGCQPFEQVVRRKALPGPAGSGRVQRTAAVMGDSERTPPPGGLGFPSGGGLSPMILFRRHPSSRLDKFRKSTDISQTYGPSAGVWSAQVRTPLPLIRGEPGAT